MAAIESERGVAPFHLKTVWWNHLGGEQQWHDYRTSVNLDANDGVMLELLEKADE